MQAHLDRLARPGYPPGFRDIYSGSHSVPRDVILGVGGFDETFKQSQPASFRIAPSTDFIIRLSHEAPASLAVAQLYRT